MSLKLLQDLFLVFCLLEVLAEGRREGLRVVEATVFVELDSLRLLLVMALGFGVAGTDGAGSGRLAAQEVATLLRYNGGFQVRLDFNDDVEGRGSRVREHVRCQGRRVVGRKRWSRLAQDESLRRGLLADGDAPSVGRGRLYPPLDGDLRV